MPDSLTRWLTKAAIIGSALVLAACSMLRVAYNSAPQLAWWWLDGYLDFSAEQSVPAREALDRWFAWHRQTQLVVYADWLKSVAPRLAEPTTPQAVCALYGQVRERLQPAIDQAYVALAALAPRVAPAQLAGLEAKYAKNNAEYRHEVLAADPEKRRERSVKQSVERFERVYGPLRAAQREQLAAAARRSPFDAQLNLAEHERRQRESLQMLRRWLQNKPGPERALSDLQELARSAENPPDALQRAQQERWAAHTCQLTAELHNSMSPEQRRHARGQLESWAADLRALAADTTRQAP